MVAAKAEARAQALAQREEIVAKAEAIAAKGEDQIRWKDDTAELRELLDAWKAAQKEGARIGKDVEKTLWQRFAHARTTFERVRKHHFADLDKVNAEVAARKEALAARAEALATSTNWDATARAFRDLMAEWKTAGRGRRASDDALWARFRAAQDAFFEAKKVANEATAEVLNANLGAKEAAVKEAEALLPIRRPEAGQGRPQGGAGPLRGRGRGLQAGRRTPEPAPERRRTRRPRGRRRRVGQEEP